MNFCRGESTLDSTDRLEPIQLALQGHGEKIEFEGASMNVTVEARTRHHLQSVLETLYYCIPALLSVEMLDTPVIAEVRGSADSVTFCWGIIDSGPIPFEAVTKQGQEDRTANLHGLTTVGTLTVLEIAAGRGLVSLPAAIARLRSTNFRVTAALLDAALERDSKRGKPTP
jgi:hypothetical protein